MAEETPGSASAPSSLPDAPNLDWLRKQARRRLADLRQANPDAKLADAQLAIAREYGFPSWRALKAHIDSLTVEGQLVKAARDDTATLVALLDAHPDKVQLRTAPHGLTLLHHAAHAGNLPAVELLLRRGVDPNTRDDGDNTYPMHWAAAAGHVEVVRRLADAGGDVVGRGDDHELEVIGWATCWDGCDDDAHRAVVDLLLSRGARHHIFSAIAMNLSDELRRVVAADRAVLEKKRSHNENFQRPLHFAVEKNRVEMVSLLLDLGADPAATDGSGDPPLFYAATPPVDRRILEMLVRRGPADLFGALALGDHAMAARMLEEDPGLLPSGGGGALHLLSKRGDAEAVEWLLARGADPNARWNHFGASVTALHLAAAAGHAAIVRSLLEAGADPRTPDSQHEGDAMGWAEHFGRDEIVAMLAGWKGRG